MSRITQCFDSRQIMKNRQFEIFSYRDRRVSNIGVHYHEFYEVYFFLSGKVRFRVEGRTYDMEPGDVLLINPRELHQAEIEPGELYERIVLWIDRSYLAKLGGEGQDLTTCFDKNRPTHVNLLKPDKAMQTQLQNLLQRLSEEFYSDQWGSELMARGILLQLMVELNRQATRNGGTRKEEDNISRIVTYLGQNYDQNLTLEQLASEFYMSKYHLAHAFRSQVGTSVHRYMVFCRLMRARELMEQGRPPMEAYRASGFGDYANFYRAFKEEYGLTPKEYFKRVHENTGP